MHCKSQPKGGNRLPSVICYIKKAMHALLCSQACLRNFLFLSLRLIFFNKKKKPIKEKIRSAIFVALRATKEKKRYQNKKKPNLKKK